MSLRNIGIAALGVVCIPVVLTFSVVGAVFLVTWDEMNRRWSWSS